MASPASTPKSQISESHPKALESLVKRLQCEFENIKDILILRIVLAIIAASAFIAGIFGALPFIFNEYAWRQSRRAKLPVSREQNNRLSPTID